MQLGDECRVPAVADGGRGVLVDDLGGRDEDESRELVEERDQQLRVLADAGHFLL